MSDKKKSKQTATDNAATKTELSDEELEAATGGVTAAASGSSPIGRVLNQAVQDYISWSSLYEAARIGHIIES